MIFFTIFLLIPFVEIAVFIAVGEHIGLFTTLALAFFTAILGGGIIKYQGLQTLMAFKTEARSGHLPEREIFDGLCLVAAGALLITPGFVTDTIGFSLLIPQLRDVLRNLLKERIKVYGVQSDTRSKTSYQYKNPNGDIIEGEFEDVSESPRGKTKTNSSHQIDQKSE